MTCSVSYVSKYIDGCDISKFGEGCEKCVSYFPEYKWTIITIFGITIIALVIAIIISKSKNFKKFLLKYERDL